jgi:predicted NBD/HSP70 family sugar kinase
MSVTDADTDNTEAAPLGCGPVFPEHNYQSRSLRKQVFEHVRAYGNAARIDTARALSISAGSVTGIAAELIADGFLREVEDVSRREMSRGRPPVALEVVADSFYVIGINLSDKTHSAVLTDAIGTVIAESKCAADKQRGSAAKIVADVAPLVHDLLATSGMTKDQIAVMGVAISGAVDHTTGFVSWSPQLAEINVDLGKAFAEVVDCPVFVDNDANIITLAELWFGEGRAKSNFAVVTVEHGVGMGLVLNNRLFRGARGMGMELGHTKVQLDGALCRCGQRGCLEAYLADYALMREAATALGLTVNQTSKVSLEVLFSEAKQGNTAAKAIFDRAAKYLALGLANIVQLFDPAVIILSGERMRYDYLYADDMLAQVHRLTLNSGSEPCEIATHAWGDLIWARGASALALSAATDTLVGSPRQ